MNKYLYTCLIDRTAWLGNGGSVEFCCEASTFALVPNAAASSRTTCFQIVCVDKGSVLLSITDRTTFRAFSVASALKSLIRCNMMEGQSTIASLSN